MPIYGDMKDVTFQSHPFYPVVESPGVVFIVKKEDSSNAAEAVMEAVFQGWPVLLLTLIMAALSGIVVWALVSKYNLLLLLKHFCYNVYTLFRALENYACLVFVSVFLAERRSIAILIMSKVHYRKYAAQHVRLVMLNNKAF